MIPIIKRLQFSGRKRIAATLLSVTEAALSEIKFHYPTLGYPTLTYFDKVSY